jgi:HlyD family secretion protein
MTERSASKMKHNSSPSESASEEEMPLMTVERSRGTRPAGNWKRRFLIFISLAALILVGNAWQTNLKKSDQPPVAAATSQLIYALGRLEPEGEIISIAAPGAAGDARIASLGVAEGDTVQAGDTLAVLDSEARLQEAANVAEKDVAHAKASLALTRAEVASQREQLAASLRTAEADLAQAEKAAARYEELTTISAVSAERNEDTRLKRVGAAEAVIRVRANLDRFGSGSFEESPDIAVARQELERAEAALKQLQVNLADSRVVAPNDGTVLRILARPGERIGQNPILEMGDTSRMMARVEVYESEVSGLALGQKATLASSALAHPLSGEITRISSLVRRQEIIEPNPAANTDARVMEVWVKLDPGSSRIASRFVNLQVRVAFEK